MQTRICIIAEACRSFATLQGPSVEGSPFLARMPSVPTLHGVPLRMVF